MKPAFESFFNTALNTAVTTVLTTAALLVTGTTAFGQVQQASHCDCNQSGGYAGYQACNWNSCQSCNSKPSRQSRGGGRMAEFWTKNRFGNCCATKAYPDSGWAPPAHVPVHHDGVWYGNYHPQALYGNPGGGFVANYPVVYAPTDTTQLGYSYAKVPTWQSRPGMLPPPPIPGNFHHRVCPGGGCFDGGGYGGGGMIHHGSYDPSCQSCNHGYAMSAPVMQQPQYMSPGGQHVVRRATPEKQGLLGGFRLTSMTELFD